MNRYVNVSMQEHISIYEDIGVIVKNIYVYLFVKKQRETKKGKGRTTKGESASERKQDSLSWRTLGIVSNFFLQRKKKFQMINKKTTGERET